MNNQHVKATSTVITCPWCRGVIPLTVNVGFVNRHAPQRKRSTGVTVRRTASVEHNCVDPTSVRPI